MHQLRFTARFRLDYRRSIRRGCDVEKLKGLLALLRRGAPLPLDCRDASVKGTAARACRVEPGWVLIYQKKEGMVTLLRMKYIPGKRPKAAPPMGLWFRTLLRSPVKTALTVLLLAVASFLLLDNLSSYAMQTQAIKQAEEAVEGVLTVERSPVTILDVADRSYFLLTDPTNPSKTYKEKHKYENYHHEALSEAEVEALEALPYIDAVDRRYMTAGVSEDYLRIGLGSNYFGYEDRVIFEATVNSNLPKENSMFLNMPGNVYALDQVLTLKDVNILAGNREIVEKLMKTKGGRADLSVLALMEQYIGTDGNIWFQMGKEPVFCLDYELGPEDVQAVKKDRRYLIVARMVPLSWGDTVFYLGDDTRKDWWPYFTDITDLPENYLESEEFAPLRELMQVTDDDAHTFDVVYTDDMASIRRVTQQQMKPVQGRFLTPEDRESPVCVVSEAFLKQNGLNLGDSITLKLGDYLMEQYAPLGAVASTRGRYATQWEKRSFTIVGSFEDVSDKNWLDKDLYWAYNANTIFVPATFLPASCDTANHVFHPGEISFLVRDAENIPGFVEESLPLVEQMGLSYAWNDAGWSSVAEKLYQSRRLALMKLLVFTAAALLAAGLTFYLFLLRRRKEYAILRALGSPPRAAAKALWLPLMALAAFAAVLGLAGAWQRSGAAAIRSAEEFVEAGLEVMPAVHIEVYLLGVAGLLLVIALLSSLYLRVLGKRSPLRLLQDGKRRKVKNDGLSPSDIGPEALAAAANMLSYPMSVTGKPVKGFLRRYVLRHIRRAGLKTVLTLLLAALLVGAVGQLTLLRSRYAEMLDHVEVTARFFGGLSDTKAKRALEDGYVRDPKLQHVIDEAELEFKPTSIWFLNRFDSFISDPITWLDGWDEESASAAFARVCVLPAPVMEEMGISLGDEVRINELGCIDILQQAYKQFWLSEEEKVALRDEYRSFYRVIGRVETDLDQRIVYAPAESFFFYPSFGYVLYYDMAEFTLNDYREADVFRRYAEDLCATSVKTVSFEMDTSDADRIYRVYRLIETLYPLTVAAALILGTLLPVLMILQEQKEAAILRALGWSKKLTIRRLTLEQAVLCLAGLVLAVIALFAVNGSGFLGVIVVPLVYVAAHFALCVGASAAISASILQKSPMRLLQVKE